MAKLKRNKTFKYTIRGDEWKVVIYTPNGYVKRFGHESAAEIDVVSRIIHINSECISERVVTHEICHAYISYCNYSDAQLDLVAVEEIFCQMIEKQGEELIQVAKDIYKKIEKYYQPKVEEADNASKN